MDRIVRLIPVDKTDKAVLRRLLELYLYDFSEYTGEDVDRHGFYSYDYLDPYWTDPDRHPFLLWVDEHIAGFVLVRGRLGPDGQRVHYIAEFFVMRKYRRRKVGREAAFLAFNLFPGKWRVSQIKKNLPAQRFWRQVIGEYTGGRFREVPNESADGPMQEFIAPAGG
jgi:predicted acetyltransferase